MVATGLVQSARESLGRVGAFLPESPDDPTPPEFQRQACRRLEEAGFRAAWTNELIGKDSFVQLAVLLAATEHMAFGTCIANIWARPAQTAHGAATMLAQAYPGRLIVGFGVGYPEQAAAVGNQFGRPVDTMTNYLAIMDAAATNGPRSYARVLGANGPRMLDLAASLTDGALPAGKSPADTAAVRSVLGPDKLLIIYLDVGARHGSAQQAAATIDAHLAAGADHVIAGVSFGTSFRTSAARLEELAPFLATLH